LLPEHVARIDVRTNYWPNGITEAQEGRNVVDEMERMKLERDPLHAMPVGMLCQFLPHWDRLLPLPLSQGDCVRRPRIPDPVDRRRARAVATATRHTDDGRYV
jgi:hypothetical protein